MAIDQAHEPEAGSKGLTRKQTLGVITVAGVSIALPKFLKPSDALAGGEADSIEAEALFLGQDELPIPPTTAKRYTTACQFCNVGCGYIVYTWPIEDTPKAGAEGAVGGGAPTAVLGDWVSPSFVTRRDINGVDSFIAVVPDKDCVVNKGDHSPRGATNALTIYTTHEHPLTKPSERLLKPQTRGSKGGDLADASWDEAIDLVVDKLKETIDAKGPSAVGLWGADHLSAEKNFAETRLFFAKAPLGLYDEKRGPDEGVAVRAIHNRAKWNSEHPSLGEHFGSSSSLLYSYSDFEAADTIMLSGANTYETGTVLYNRMHAVDNNKIVIDPRRTVPAANAEASGGVHLQIKPGTDVVILNSLMNVILAENLHDAEFIKSRTNAPTFDQLKKTVSDPKYKPENTEKVTGVPAEKVRAAARMVGKPNKTSILFEKGVIWQGTQNEAVLSSYANLALLVGALGREGRVFGRQGGHQDAYMFDFDWPHPQDGLARRNLWQELEKGTIDFLLVTICNPLRMSQQTKQLREWINRVPFVVEVNIRPSDMTEVADVVLPATQWGEYTYTRANLERRLRINEQFCDPAGEARPDYLIVSQIAKRYGEKHGTLDPTQWEYAAHADFYDAMRETEEGKALGLNLLSRDRLKQLGTNGIQMPITEQGGDLVGTKRAYEDKFATEDGKANFVARDQSWTDSDPLAFLPEPIKPNDEYPYFVTTVRYQAIWQSGYTYRWTTDLAKQVPYHEITINPEDATKLDVNDGDWVELVNQFGSTEGVANVSDVVQPGLMSAVFAWQGPTDENPNGEPRFYANNLVAGGELQQKSNAAFFKNTRANLRKLDREPITAKTAPTMSLQDRTVDDVKGTGAAGNPQSKAQDRLKFPATPGSDEPAPVPDFEAG